MAPRADYAAIAEQAELPILFYDERHRHRLAKAVRNGSREQIPLILETAGELLAGIPIEERDFDRAKADVMTTIRLNSGDAPQNQPP